MNLLFFLNPQREVLMCAVSVAVSKHVSRYGPQSGFSYYNLIKLMVSKIKGFKWVQNKPMLYDGLYMKSNKKT
jgi:hypothetical protein